VWLAIALMSLGSAAYGIAYFVLEHFLAFIK